MRLYLDRLNLVHALDTEPTQVLTREVAQRMALWMTFEDVARVAQLKTRPGRLREFAANSALAKTRLSGLRTISSLAGTKLSACCRHFSLGFYPKSKARDSNGLALHIPTGSTALPF